jgi:hypothetical protein
MIGVWLASWRLLLVLDDRLSAASKQNVLLAENAVYKLDGTSFSISQYFSGHEETQET